MNEIIELNGSWDVYIDKHKKTDESSQFPPLLFQSDMWENTITVPSCWESTGVSKLFGGPVWYKKEVFIPEVSEKGNRWILIFEAVSYYCDVYVNGEWAGSHEGLWDPFELDITSLVNADSINTIYVKIYKPTYGENDRFNYRETLTGFIPDVASTFGGIWKPVHLVERSPISIHRVSLRPNIYEGKIGVWVFLNRASDKTDDVVLDLSIVSKEGDTAAEDVIGLRPDAAGRFYYEMSIDHPILWDTENPYMYNLHAALRCGNTVVDKIVKRFGMREIKADGDKVLLNGRPIYIRGLLHWGYYPDTICPNPSRSVIEDEIRKAKDMGFNLIKHCLYIASDQYYEAADENGMLIWQELPLWLPRSTPQLKQRIRSQYPRLIQRISDHPSLCICTLGCELDAGIDAGLLEEMYHTVKDLAGNILVRDNSGSGECYGGLPIDFADFYDYHFYADLHYIENLMEVFTPQWRTKRPWLYGEFCDSDTFRDIRTLAKRLDRSQLWWLSDSADQNPLSSIIDMPVTRQASLFKQYGIEDEIDVLKSISCKQSLLHRKFTVEAVRQFPEISGYVITGFRDVPITTSGLFDDLMEPKFNAKDFKAFNADIVLSLGWDLKRVWANGGDRVLNTDHYNYWSNEDAGLHVIISNYSNRAIDKPKVKWRLCDSAGSVVSEGDEASLTIIEPGAVKELAAIRIKMPNVSDACAFDLLVTASDAFGNISNSWRFWVYPDSKPDIEGRVLAVYDPLNVLSYLKDRYGASNIEGWESNIHADMVVATQMTPAIERYISAGGKAFYIQRAGEYLPMRRCPFWREAVKRLYDHEVLRRFPNDGFTDLQFFGLATDMAIDTQRSQFKQIRPIIRRVDARNFYVTDYMAEIEIGHGSMIATTLRLEGGMGKQPNALEYNKAGIYLSDQVIAYLLDKR